MTGLLVAQQIAGATKVKIVARDGKSRAEIVERLEHVQPALRGIRQLLVRRRGEICVGALLGAADAATQLIELREAELIRAVHDECIGGRNVEARFDDVGGQENIDLAVVERRHRFFQPGRADLAMRRRRLHFGNRRLEEFHRAAEIGDARHDVEALAATIMLAQQRFANGERIERRHIGAHRQAVDRRRRDQRQVAHA